MAKVWVKAIIDSKLYLKIPGQIIRLWGHDFIIQLDGSLCMEMHTDFVAGELKKGRVEQMSSPPPGKDVEAIHKKITIVEPAPPKEIKLTMDIGTYYGAGDLNNLIEKVTSLSNKAKAQFAKERFPGKKALPVNMKKEDMVDKIRSYIDSTLMTIDEDD